jgi:hypothetical protein
MGIYAIASGIGDQENANLYAQNAMAIEGISLAPAILQLSQMYMQLIAQDSLNYSNATVNSMLPNETYPSDPQQGTGPHMAAIAAQDNVQKDIDQNASDLNTGNVSNITETLKSTVGYLGQNLDDVFKTIGPIVELLAQVVSIIMEI